MEGDPVTAHRPSSEQWPKEESISSKMSMVPKWKENSLVILQIFMEYVPDSRAVLGDGIQGGIRSSSYHPRAHGKIYNKQRFPRASQVTLVVKNPPARAGDIRDMGSIPGSRRSPEGGGHGNPLQCSCLENPMDWSNLAHMQAWSY